MPDLLPQLPNGHGQGVELTESERYRILSDERRRLVLDILDDHATGIGLEDLSELVADRTDAATARQVQISLHHKHLPMLDDYDVAEYDHEARWVQVQ